MLKKIQAKKMGQKLTAMIRLNKFLAQTGLGSRRSVEKYIKSGEVRVNGAQIRSPAFLITPDSDSILFRGNPVGNQEYTTYIALNKPAGYITTAKDEKGRNTVFKLVSMPQRAFPVGRLDRDSNGLLLLTNDGELAHRLMHPRYKVKKQYLVHLNRKAGREVKKAFREGVLIDGKYNVTAEVRFPNKSDTKTCEVTISEGKNRQIRKMFARLGYRVAALQRLAIGPLRLGKLKSGSWRYLTDNEINALKKAVGLIDGNYK